MYKVYQDVKINHIWVPRHLSGHTKLNVKYESIAVTFPHHRVTKMKPSVTCHVSGVTRLSATNTVCVPTAFLRQPSCSFLYLLMTYVSLLIRPQSLVKSQHNSTYSTCIRFHFSILSRELATFHKTEETMKRVSNTILVFLKIPQISLSLYSIHYNFILEEAAEAFSSIIQNVIRQPSLLKKT